MWHLIIEKHRHRGVHSLQSQQTAVWVTNKTHTVTHYQPSRSHEACTPHPTLMSWFPLLSHDLKVPSVLWRCWLGGRKGIQRVKTEWWGAGVVICLKWGADLHMPQLMPLPLTDSCFSKIQIGFTFLVPAHLGSPGKGPLNGCVTSQLSYYIWQLMLTDGFAVLGEMPLYDHYRSVIFQLRTFFVVL